MNTIWEAAFAVAALAVPAAAAASDTVSYTYDALGRLNDISVSGGPNAGSVVAIRYDPAGNRTSHSVSGTGASGLGPVSQSSTSGGTAALDEAATRPGETNEAEEIPPVLVEPPPPGGIPDESEPAVEADVPEGTADARGGQR